MPVKLPVLGADLRQWGRQLNTYLSRNLGTLFHKTDDDNPSVDGIFLWDDVNEYPIVSFNNEFRQIVMEGGHATLIRSTSVTAAAADTAYSITYDAPTNNSRIDRDSTNAERIVFSEKGEYLLNFSAEIRSSTSSDVTFYFWPSKNGTNLAGSTMVNTLHNNNANLVVSRSAIIEFDANDYLEVKWAVSSTSGSLNATSATAFSPASPASTLSITRIHS